MNIFEEGNKDLIIQEMSTFPKSIIGTILAKLMSRVEGEEFIYQEAYHETYKRVSTVFGGERFKTTTNVIALVQKGKESKRFYDYDEYNNVIRRLEEQGKMLVLDETEYSFTKNLTFYSAGSENINLSSFPYVKEFIDKVVEYRIKNKLKEISIDELEVLMIQFIIEKKELIIEKYEVRLKEYQERMEEKITKEKEEERLRQETEELDILMREGPKSSFDTPLEDRISQDEALKDQLEQLLISYENEQSIATLINTRTILSTNDMLITEVDLKSQIKDYFDDSEADPHFHGFCDIDIEDDGLMGIIDISKAKSDIVKEITELKGKYRIDKIGNKYLRILYLPNNGKYSHKTTNIYAWILSTDNAKEKDPTSYKTSWNKEEESKRMQDVMKEIQLLTALDKNQIDLYKQKKKNK